MIECLKICTILGAGTEIRVAWVAATKFITFVYLSQSLSLSPEHVT